MLETHAHADHLSAAPYRKETLGGRTAIGENICTVQRVFKRIFNLGVEVQPDGRQFDHLFGPDETFAIGALQARALLVPGHTPADLAYQIGDAVFVGDTLFMPDVGSARCDFPGGDARMLYRSVRMLLSLPPQTRLFMCHDYPPQTRKRANAQTRKRANAQTRKRANAQTREPQWQTTVGEQRRSNIHLHDGVSEEAFVAMRTARDRTLAVPVLILPAIQINMRAGALPAAEDNGIRYLKIPLNAL